MRKKVIASLLCAVAVTACIFAFVACNDSRGGSGARSDVFEEGTSIEEIRTALLNCGSFTAGYITSRLTAGEARCLSETSNTYSDDAYSECSKGAGTYECFYAYSDGTTVYEALEVSAYDEVTGNIVGEPEVTERGPSDEEWDFAGMKERAVNDANGHAGGILALLKEEGGSIVIDRSVFSGLEEAGTKLVTEVRLQGDEIRCIISLFPLGSSGEGYRFEYYIRINEEPVIPGRILALK